MPEPRQGLLDLRSDSFSFIHFPSFSLQVAGCKGLLSLAGLKTHGQQLVDLVLENHRKSKSSKNSQHIHNEGEWNDMDCWIGCFAWLGSAGLRTWIHSQQISDSLPFRSFQILEKHSATSLASAPPHFDEGFQGFQPSHALQASSSAPGSGWELSQGSVAECRCQRRQPGR